MGNFEADSAGTGCACPRVLCLLLALVIGASASEPLQAQQRLRFAQITDVHLFDAGQKCFAPDVEMEYAANLEALKWAFATINQKNKANKVDFVVFTGDLGIENLSLPGEAAPSRPKPDVSGCNPRTPIGDDYGPIKPLTVEQASGEMAGLLGRLQVPTVYFVPGNNDLREEDPADRKRYVAFIGALALKLPGRIRDLTGETVATATDPPDALNGFRLIGMDSASFKPTPEERKSGPATVASGAIADCEDPHPDSDISAAREKEVQRVADAVAKTTSPLLIFTHVPDLADPYGPRGKNDKQTCLMRSAWFLNSKAVLSWKATASSKSLVGIFAGHFHADDARLYGHPEKNVFGEDGRVYVAPPLAMRLQWNSPDPQRGLVLYDVATTRETAGAAADANSASITPDLSPYRSAVCCGTAAARISGKAPTMEVPTRLLAFLIASLTIFLVFLVGAFASRLQGHKFRWLYALIELETNTYSLTKLQFYAWTWLTVFSYSYLSLAHMYLQHQFDMPDVPDTLAKLFGISAATTGGAIIASAVGRSKGGGSFDPRLSDLITSGGEVASDRAQFLVWSAVAVLGYFLKVLSTDPAAIQVLPDLPSNLLLLSGVSSGGYLLGRFARTPGPVVGKVVVPAASTEAEGGANGGPAGARGAGGAAAGATAGIVAGAVAAEAVAGGAAPVDAALQGAGQAMNEAQDDPDQQTDAAAAGGVAGAIAGGVAGAAAAAAQPMPPHVAAVVGAVQGGAAGAGAGAAAGAAVVAAQQPHLLQIDASGVQPGFTLLFQAANETPFRPLAFSDPKIMQVNQSGTRKTTSITIEFDDAAWAAIAPGGMLRFVNLDGRFAEQKIAPIP